MIKFVYFDLGGVVIQDFSGTNNWEEVKKEWNITDKYWDEFEPKLCVGKEIISPEFLNAFVGRFEANPSIWPVIRAFHQKIPTGLLTNMYPNMFAAIKNKNILPDVVWDIIIDSSIEKIAKPNPAIYKLAQRKAGVKDNEILFVENTKNNLGPASFLGWQTFLYDSARLEESSQKLLDLFNSF